MMKETLYLLLALAGSGALRPAMGQTFPPPLSDEQAAFARSAIAEMKRDPRGPYLRIRWFCADGTVQPPAGTPCRERGGGVQYAELNETAKRLAELQVHVGTILQSLSFEEFFDAGRDHYRVKEYILARHLFEIDDGWALRAARYYRGARQIEDEERQGQAFLERMLADKAWLARNYLLAAQAVANVPHARLGDDASTAGVRNLATEIADLDSSFVQIRIKIHSFPAPDDLAAVERFLAAKRHAPEVEEKLRALQRELRRLYDSRRNLEVLTRYQRRVPAALRGELEALRRAYEQGDAAAAMARIAALAPALRMALLAEPSGRNSLMLMDLMLTLQDQAFVLAVDLEARRIQPIARDRRLAFLREYLAVAYATGMLSPREHGALDAEIEEIVGEPTLAAFEYHERLAYLARSLDWSVGTVRAVFGPVVQRYRAFEPRAADLLDATVRATVLLPYSVELSRLQTDADRVLGTSHEILESVVSQGVMGLNPGVAMLPLEIVEPGSGEVKLDATKIYVLPETTAELQPAGGLLTLESGGLLSHVQLLARNLGIPNASISSSLLPVFRQYEGAPVFYAVTPMGRVVVRDTARLTREERALVAVEERESRQTRVRLDTSRLRLARADPIPLTELRAEHSGVVVGPKAANLGQLAFYFPEHVSAGVALPFGLFLRHVNRPLDSGRTLMEELDQAYARAREMRSEGVTEAEIDRFMFEQLARTRRIIMELEWQPDVRRSIVEAIEATFGDDLERGVFVRSDTNVEDLPQFSGAGLNLTVPHQRSLDDVLLAIRRVWTSPFSERAYLWRKGILEDQGRVYPSVLLLESIHSEKSGVLITSGLQVGGPHDLTISTAEGVGGAVEGEQAETIVVAPDGEVRLLSQTKAPFRRALVDRGSGGVEWLPARRPDRLLGAAEIAALQAAVQEWKTRFAGADADRVWDIEFGFADGKLWLFQIRPFVQHRSSRVLERLGALDREVMRNADKRIVLQERI